MATGTIRTASGILGAGLRGVALRGGEPVPAVSGLAGYVNPTELTAIVSPRAVTPGTIRTASGILGAGLRGVALRGGEPVRPPSGLPGYA